MLFCIMQKANQQYEPESQVGILKKYRDNTQTFWNKVV